MIAKIYTSFSSTDKHNTSYRANFDIVINLIMKSMQQAPVAPKPVKKTTNQLSTRLANRLLDQMTRFPLSSELIVITPRELSFSNLFLVASNPIAMHAVAHASADMQSSATIETLSKLDVSLPPVLGLTMWLTFFPFTSLNLR